MTEESALAELIGGYFHEDMFEVYSDEFAAATDFAASDPGLAAALPGEVENLLARVTEAELEQHLDRLGNAIEPAPGVTYREWLTQIADHVRTATA